MSIKLRIILVTSLTFLLGGGIALYILWLQVADNVDREVLGTAQMVIDGALAARAYTIDREHGVRAVLHNTKNTFFPQTVPAYAARQITKRLKDHSVSYREAMLNPTNPENRMGTREMDLYREFSSSPDKTRLTGRWVISSKEFLYLATPIVVTNPACLACHGKPEDAPPAMLALYGKENGFGWKLNKVLGVRLATVPYEIALNRAMGEFKVFSASLIAISLMILLIIYLILQKLIITPMKLVTKKAVSLANGELGHEEFGVSAHKADEISMLMRSMDRVQRSFRLTHDMINKLKS